MDTDQDPVGFRDDLDEQNEHAARVRLDLEEEYGLENESRRVDIRRLCEVVRMKRERSMKGRKFAFFLVFTVFYGMMLFVQRAPYDSQTIRQAFADHYLEATFRDHSNMEPKQYADIVTVEDVWMWLNYVFVPKTYYDTYDNGEPRNASDAHTLLISNRLTKGFRMVQRRVKNHSAVFCVDRPYYEDFAPNCYGRTFLDGRIGDVDDTPFFSPDDKVRYEYSEESSGLGTWLDQNVGYFQDFDFNRTGAVERLQSLQRNRWINSGTAWLRADLTAYNANVNRIIFVKFTFEFENTGRINPLFEVRTIKGDMYATGDGILRLLLEGFVVVIWAIVTYLMIRDAITSARTSKHYFKHFNNLDNIAEAAQQLIFLAILIIYIFIVSYPFADGLQISEDTITNKDGKMINADSLSMLWEVYFIINAVNLLITLFRMLSFVRINPNISQLTDTFAHCRDQIAQFAVVLALLLITFTIMANLMFGAKVYEFSTIARGFLSTVQIMIGNGDYFLISDADTIAAPLFYYPFILIMIFVVFNMTIAIIMDGYNLTVEKRKEAMTQNLKDLFAKSVFAQFYDGALRLLAPIGHSLPVRIRLKKTPSGIEYDRFLAPDKYRTFELLTEVIAKAQEEQYIPFDLFHMLLASASSTSHRVESSKFLVERYNAWEDLQAKAAEDKEAVQERARQLRQVFAKIELLKEKLASIQRVQHRMGNTMDVMLRSWSVETLP